MTLKTRPQIMPIADTSPSYFNGEAASAGAASELISLIGAAHRVQVSPDLPDYPAARTLDYPRERRAKIEKAFRRFARELYFALLRQHLAFQFQKLLLELQIFGVKLQRIFLSVLP